MSAFSLRARLVGRRVGSPLSASFAGCRLLVVVGGVAGFSGVASGEGAVGARDPVCGSVLVGVVTVLACCCCASDCIMECGCAGLVITFGAGDVEFVGTVCWPCICLCVFLSDVLVVRVASVSLWLSLGCGVVVAPFLNCMLIFLRNWLACSRVLGLLFQVSVVVVGALSACVPVAVGSIAGCPCVLVWAAGFPWW